MLQEAVCTLGEKGNVQTVDLTQQVGMQAWCFESVHGWKDEDAVVWDLQDSHTCTRQTGLTPNAPCPQAPCLLASVFLAGRSLMCILCNLTTNEWFNRHRYVYLNHEAAGYSNRFVATDQVN